jgi:protein-S-isoprenylcysteine O-methyltransferase Ste14
MSTPEKTLNPDSGKSRVMTMMFIRVLVAAGWASGIMFMIFLFTGSFTLIPLRFSLSDALVMDGILSVLFFLQHSIFVRRGFKQWLGNFMPERYLNAFYGLTSGIALMLVLIFWQKTSPVITEAEGMFHWILRGLFFLSLYGFYLGVRALGSFDALGVKPLILYEKGREERPQQIIIKGPYRWVRHPLYLFMIVLIWSCPALTYDRLLFNILWTIWIVIGTYLEDRDLHRTFGRSYREYSARVPMLVPYRVPEKEPLRL